MPFSHRSSLSEPSLWEAGLSLVHEVEPTLHWGSDEVRFFPIADVPFSRLSAAPFLTSLLAARVSLWRWLPSPLGEEPFELVPPNPLRNWFRQPSPSSSVYRSEEPSRRHPVSSSRIPFVPFGAVDLSGLTASGHLAFPSCYLSNMALAVSPDFDLWRSLRNT